MPAPKLLAARDRRDARWGRGIAKAQPSICQPLGLTVPPSAAVVAVTALAARDGGRAEGVRVNVTDGCALLGGRHAGEKPETPVAPSGDSRGAASTSTASAVGESRVARRWRFAGSASSATEYDATCAIAVRFSAGSALAQHPGRRTAALRWVALAGFACRAAGG